MSFRTDLAAEACARTPNCPGTSQKEYQKNGFSIIETEIDTAQAAALVGKPVGRYRTLSLRAFSQREEDTFSRSCTVLAELLRDLLPKTCQTVLVVGLGNRSITPDAIGPQTISHVIATRHLIKQEPAYFADWCPVCAVAPGVLGQTGVETAEIVRGLVAHVQPDAVIAVDALATGRLSHLLRTIQCADVGIVPGSGVENARAALNQETLGIPVVAIGVPTVVDGATLAHEILAQSGISGCEALDALSEPILVTTRDIDRAVGEVSKVIGYAINLALHPHLSIADIELCLN